MSKWIYEDGIDPSTVKPTEDNNFLNAPIGSFFDGHVVNDPFHAMDNTNAWQSPSTPVWNSITKTYEFPGVAGSGPSAPSGGGGFPPGGAGPSAPGATAPLTVSGLPDWAKLLASVVGPALASAFAPAPFQQRKSFVGTAADPTAILGTTAKDLNGLIAGLMKKMAGGVDLPGATVHGIPGLTHDPMEGTVPHLGGIDLGSLGQPPDTTPTTGVPTRLPVQAGAVGGMPAPTAAPGGGNSTAAAIALLRQAIGAK